MDWILSLGSSSQISSPVVGPIELWRGLKVCWCFLPSWISASRDELEHRHQHCFFFCGLHFILGSHIVWLCICSQKKRHETSTGRERSEDSAVAPNEAEEWRHTATTCWQNRPTPALQRWTGTLSDVFNPPASQKYPPLRGTFIPCITSPCEKKKKSCLLELAAILGVSWAILTGLNLPEEDKTGKRRQSSIIPLERFLDGCFSPCIASSSRLSHEPVSKAPLCSSASNVVPFPASSLNINNRGTLFPHQYTSILILKGLSTRETKFNVKWQDVLPTPFFSFWLAVKQLLVWGMLLLFKPDCRQRKEAVHTALTYIDNFWSWFCKNLLANSRLCRHLADA